MKRFIGFVMGIILTIGVMVFSFSACGFNKLIFDFTYEYEYDTAIINMFDGTVKEVKIKSWTDYEGEQLQITDTEGKTWLVSSINCHLINE